MGRRKYKIQKGEGEERQRNTKGEVMGEDPKTSKKRGREEEHSLYLSGRGEKYKNEEKGKVILKRCKETEKVVKRVKQEKRVETKQN